MPFYYDDEEFDLPYDEETKEEVEAFYDEDNEECLTAAERNPNLR